MYLARDAHERRKVAAPPIGQLLDFADYCRAIDRDAARSFLLSPCPSVESSPAQALDTAA